MIPKTQQTTIDGADNRKSGIWLHWAIVLLVFSITGSLSMFMGRFLLSSILQVEGGFLSGPWLYRILYVLLVPPLYSLTLVAIGTVFGKHTYFKQRVLKMWGRILIR